ncbi:MAG: MBL fold metallo-hydrolase [Actinomycetes bacterium]|jgi:glyoxylase-like metal-dependent hydrolase (beta-lactamase superfamily II)|nr:MBL fold metallo-hydrolase [Actinomycetes bacterium]
MKIDNVVVGDLDTNCWLIEGPDGSVVIIDPGDEAERIMDAVAGRTVDGVLLTHAHFDHLGAADQVADEAASYLYLPGPETRHMHQHVNERVARDRGVTVPIIDFYAADGEELHLAGLVFRVMVTPGHTPGASGYVVRDPEGGQLHYFSGDTLFAHDIGRTDFPGGSETDMTDSLARIARELPPSTIVYPGHGPTTTIAEELAFGTLPS